MLIGGQLVDSYEGGTYAEISRKDSTLPLAIAQQTWVLLFGLPSAHTVTSSASSTASGVETLPPSSRSRNAGPNVLARGCPAQTPSTAALANNTPGGR